MTPDWDALFAELRRAASVAADGPAEPLSGGIWRVLSDRGPLFLKTCALTSAARLAAEGEGLALLGASAAFRVPEVVAVGATAADAFLATEWLDLRAPSAHIDREFGAELAGLHRITAPAHGWHRDNTIGPTLQLNAQSTSWLEFYRERRLGFQLDLAARNGFETELADLRRPLMAALTDLLASHEPPPSLLHGDLWSGNYACCDNRPAVYDPAVYFGDRETDLAMTRLFGGFSAAFYEAYADAWPLPPGHERRLPLYQLYHVLNHLNLFGRGYLAQTITLVRRLVA